MARRRSKPFETHIVPKTVKLKNKKKKGCYTKKIIQYCWWYDDNGKRISASTGCELKSDAKDVVEEWKKNGTLRCRDAAETLAEYAEPFFDENRCPILTAKKAAKKDFSVDGARWTRGQVKHHIIDDKIGEISITSLKPSDITDWRKRLLTEYKLGNNSANKQMRYLRQILDVAVQEKLIPENPSKGIKNLDDDSKDRPAYTEDEIKMLFNEPWEDVYSYVACLTASDTAVRISEIRGLQPRDIKETTLKISRSYSRSGVRPTKNKEVAEVPVDPIVRDWLLKLSEGRKEDEFIFSLDGKKPIENKVILASLYEAMEKRGIDRNKYKDMNPDAKLPLTFHSFRHAVATILADKGIPIAIIGGVLRHKDLRSTQRYMNPENYNYEAVRDIQRQLLDKNGA